jgi:hypothetical protein
MKNLKFPSHFQQYPGKIGDLFKTLIVDPKLRISVLEIIKLLESKYIHYFLFRAHCRKHCLMGNTISLYKQEKGNLSYALKQLISTQLSKFISRRLKATKKSRVRNEFYNLFQLNHPSIVKLQNLFLKTIFFILYLN